MDKTSYITIALLAAVGILAISGLLIVDAPYEGNDYKFPPIESSSISDKICGDHLCSPAEGGS